jgi:condensin complex subunit 2
VEPTNKANLTRFVANAAANADSSGDEGGEGGPGEGDGTQRPTKAKRARAANATTLADSFAKIQVKELDLEFTVDPLFKKTSADFDEGGAAGLLMNHLSSDATMRVVFDAGDAKVEQEDEENDKQAEQEEGNEKIDISKLKGEICFILNSRI